MPWLRDYVHRFRHITDRLLEEGYACAWTRYRTEVELGYEEGGKLIIDGRQGMELMNRAPLEYEDEVAVLRHVAEDPRIDADRLLHLGVSHAGEMLLKLCSQYPGLLRAGVAAEPASHEVLMLRISDEPTVVTVDGLRDIESLELRSVEHARSRIADPDEVTRRLSGVDIPVLVLGREEDELQGVFRLTYDLLAELRDDVEWRSWSHHIHGYVYPETDEAGVLEIDDVQRESLDVIIDFFNRTSGGLVDDLEPDVGRAQARHQVVAHGLGGGDLAGGGRVVVEGERQRRLGQHLRGLAVAGVAAGDPGVDGPAVTLADEVDGEPRLLALGLVGPLALLDLAEQQVAQRLDLRRDGDGAHPGHASGGVAQRLETGEVGVAELRPVRRQGGAAARHDQRVDQRHRQQPEPQHACRGAACLQPGGMTVRRRAWPSARRRAEVASFIWRGRDIAFIAEWKVPPENMPLARTTPRTVTGPDALSCCTVKRAPRSCGIESKPQACTIRAPVRSAVAWWATYIRSTNSGSPVRST